MAASQYSKSQDPCWGSSEKPHAVQILGIHKATLGIKVFFSGGTLETLGVPHFRFSRAGSFVAMTMSTV